MKRYIYILKKISLLCIKAKVELLLASLLFTTYMFSVRYIMGSVSSSSAPKIKTEDSWIKFTCSSCNVLLSICSSVIATTQDSSAAKNGCGGK